MTIKKNIFFILSITSLVFTVDNIQGQVLTLTKKQANEDYKALRFALEYVHPRLYKYDDKKTVDARFDSLSGRINNNISGLDFLALVSKTNAAVRCGHLYTIPQGQLATEILVKKVVPFHIKILEDKLYILNDCSSSSILSGSQILTINGKSDRQIFDAIIPGIASDGYIQTRKLRLMERYFFYQFHGFDLYYHLHVDRSDVFKIEYIEFGTNKRKTVTVKGISIDERQKILLKKYSIDEAGWFNAPSPKFEINKQNDFALLTVSRSFYDKTIDPNFDSLLNSALIIERDTSNLLYNNDDEYMRRINDNLWINNYEYSDNLTFRQPKDNVFTGKLYVLINGISFSSAADLVSDLKKTTDAVFIGEETGGAYEGPTGGDNIVIQLPNSKIMIRISPNIHIGHMYQKHPIGRGVLPTHPTKYTIKDIVDGKDLEMELARTLIENKSR